MDEKEPIYSKYVSGNRFVKVYKLQGIGEDTNVTLAYAESDLEDDEISIPDQHEVNQNVADLLTKDDKIGKVDEFLEAICQTFSSKRILLTHTIAQQNSQCRKFMINANLRFGDQVCSFFKD